MNILKIYLKMLPAIFVAGNCGYLCLMRLVLYLLFSCFFFAVPPVAEAAGVPVYKPNKESAGAFKKNLLQQPLSIECINAFAGPAQNNNSGARYKIFPWTNNYNGDFLLKHFSFFEGENCFSHSFLYYKEISLRLLFPEHTFL